MTARTLWDQANLARTYREVRGTTGPMRRAWGAAFRAALPDARPRRSLDLGCGAGRFTAVLQETFGGTVVGVDGAPAMLAERPSAPGTPLAFVASGATALPLRNGCFDLALLSMVYHLLAPPEPALAELHRVVARGGNVLVRTPTRELEDLMPLPPFFPEMRAIDEARMPSRAALAGTFTAAGFTLARYATVEQEFAASPMEAYERVRRRPFSGLQMISDAAFAEGLARYERHCRTAPPGPLLEPRDLFVFERAR